ncbi:unnamed protein product [Adineta steineri]|uniref:Uncharacterized protein n=1 Tax=Adineta steineri TaxID=433720 RepID=A0A813PJ27_9BILA|nr:unnamed protein product [Adineta steineri]CAF4125224.1 unnamed protein product [Adineta steineri]
MDGKTVMVTGSNSGVGKYIAIELAKRGAHVILACPDRKWTEEALKEICKLSGSNNVEIEIVDLASLKSVQKCAKRLRGRLSKLDVLINNAGVMMTSEKSIDGYEIHFAVNHLGHFLLTNLLLDLMKNAPSARIINVSSIILNITINWDDINFTKPYWKFNAYSHSKLANILFTNELARRLQNTNITVNSLHPGVIRTEVIRNILGHYQIILNTLILLLTPIWYCLIKSPEQDAQTSIYLASDRRLNCIANDRCLKNIDRNKWYRLSRNDLLHNEYRERFYELNEVEDTTKFLKQSEEKSDKAPIQIISSLLTSLLTLFITLTSDHWRDFTFDIITCLNVLDCCENLLSLLKQIRNHLIPKTGCLVVSLVLPFKPYFEYNNNHRPNESIQIDGDLLEEQINN